jgi:ubiquinone/menaquinone biosynthesis C-methylase UbiE
MNIAGSYDVSHFAIDVEGEISRLNAQVDLFWPQESALYEKAGLRDGMVVLDCGCGPGHLLEKLHGLYPNLQCFGVDVDEHLVEEASRNAARKQLRRCSIDRQSILALDFPDSSFDFVVSRLVLEHLPDPVQALAEVFRVLKEDGRAVFVANDFEIHLRTWPDCPSLSELYDAYRRARRADGGNPCIGREMPDLLRKAGFADVDLHVVTAHSRIVGDAAFLKAEGAGIPAQLVKSGYLSADVLNHLAFEWRAMLSAEGHAMMRLLFAASGVKQSTPAARREFQNTSPRAADVRDPAPARDVVPQRANINSYEDLLAFMVEALAREMDVEPAVIDKGKSVIQQGGDSLAAVGLSTALEDDVFISLPVSAVLSDASVEDVARNLWERMQRS